MVSTLLLGIHLAPSVPPVPNPTRQNLTRPSISSTGIIGSGITGTAGTWAGDPVITYQYQAYNEAEELWAEIPGETSLNMAAISEAYDGMLIRLAEIPDGLADSAAVSDPVSVASSAPEISNAGSIAGSFTVGGYLSHSGLVVTGADWYPTIVWQADGSPIVGAPTGPTYGPIPAALAGKTISVILTVQNSGGSDSDSVSGSTVTYAAPTSASLGSLTLTEGIVADSVDIRSMFAVAGDPTLASCTFAVVSGGVAGMSLSGYTYSGTPDRPRAAGNVTFSATNGGGTVNSSRSVTVSERSLGTELSFNQTFDDNTTTNWSVANSASPSVSGGVLTLTAGAANAQLRHSAFDPGFSGVGRIKVPASFALSSGTGYLDFRVGTSAGGNQYAGIRYNQSTGTVQSTINGGSSFQTAKQDAAGNFYVDNITTQFVSGTNIFVSLVIQNSGAVGSIDWVRIRPHAADPVVPDAMISGQWDATDAGSVIGNVLNFAVSTAPSDGGSSITKYQYKIGSGGWTDFSPAMTSTGQTRSVTCPAWETATNVMVRAVNANGAAGDSDTKSRTPHFASSCRFVSTSGSDSNGGTYAAPWRTSGKMGSSLTAGQTGYIRPGTYAPFLVTVSGSSGNPVTIRTLPGEEYQAIISGSAGSSVSVDALTCGIGAIGRSYIAIMGLRVANVGGAGIGIIGGASGAAEIDIEGNQIDTCSNAGIYAAGRRMAPALTPTPGVWLLQGLRIRWNEITKTNETTGTNECISVGGGLKGFAILYNYIHDSRQYGIDVKLQAEDGEVAYNFIDTLLKHGLYCDCACRVNKNISWHDNWVQNAGQNLGNGITVARESGDRGPTYGFSQSMENIDFYNNILLNSGNIGILISHHTAANGTADSNVGLYQVKLRHNTVVNSGRVKATGHGVRIDDIKGTITVNIANNIINGVGGSASAISDASASVTPSNNTTTNPLFTDAAAGDFTLQAGSPAQGAGSATFRVPTDYAGYMPSLGPWEPYNMSRFRVPNTRAATPDCGALEAA